MPPEHERLIQIRELIHHYFNLEEFRTLCTDLGISYDDLGGEGLHARMRELVALCERTGRVEHLLALCRQRRPHAHWPESNTPLYQPTAISSLTPSVQNPRQIFVSHAHQDAAFAQQLATDLRQQGWDIWIAPQSIYPGEQWVTAVNRGLEESRIFLLVLTPSAAQSSWVRRETDAAIHLEQQGEIQFIPLDVQPTRRPPLWQTYHWISFRDDYGTGLVQLTRALRGEPAKPVLSRVEVASTPEWTLQREPTKASTPGVTPKAGETQVWEKDGKVMVYVPAGEFLFGDKKEKIYLDGFWIDKTPITNAEYKRFLDANPKHPVPLVNADWAKPYNWDEKKRTFPAGKENHPVVMSSWHDAKAYADWAGKDLPTEQEWEKAARGTDGREYPWGKWHDGYANTYEAGIKSSSPVGQFSPRGDSPYGCVDMAGNVWEWTATPYEGDANRRVVRGGSWDNLQNFARAASRGHSHLDDRSFNLGCRVVRRPPSP